MMRGWSVAVSDFGRFEAALAIDGLCHPPEFFGGPWSKADRRVFRVGASALATIIDCDAPIDRCSYLDMEAAIQAVRQRLLLRDATAWPALRIREPNTAPIDYTILIGWGARWWHRKLGTRRGAKALYAKTAAAMVVSAVDHALYIAGNGGAPAHFDAALTRRIAAFRVTMADLDKPARSSRRHTVNVADLIAIDRVAAGQSRSESWIGH